MTVVLLCREGVAARYLAHELYRGEALDAIVVESGREARARKLGREWSATPWWQVPILALDLAALAVYGKLWGWTLRRRLAGHPAATGYPQGVPLDRVDDANDLASVFALQELEPDVLVVFGTSILRAPVLSIPTQAALNVHGGIVPAYRNVHSEVWAALNGDAENAGTSIIHLDSGIDSGAVALQERVQGARGFFDLRWRNLELGARLALEALRKHAAGELPRDPQDGTDAGFFKTPGFGALARLAFTRVRLPR